MATIHISQTEAERDFSGLMARVRAGEEVVIEFNASPIAIITPTRLEHGRPIADCLERSQQLAKHDRDSAIADADFAADMEAIVCARRPAERQTWD